MHLEGGSLYWIDLTAIGWPQGSSSPWSQDFFRLKPWRIHIMCSTYVNGSSISWSEPFDWVWISNSRDELWGRVFELLGPDLMTRPLFYGPVFKLRPNTILLLPVMGWTLNSSLLWNVLGQFLKPKGSWLCLKFKPMLDESWSRAFLKAHDLICPAQLVLFLFSLEPKWYLKKWIEVEKI